MPKAGWPFTAEIALKYSDDDKNWKLEFDFGDSARRCPDRRAGGLCRPDPLGPCPKCAATAGGQVFEHGKTTSATTPCPPQPSPAPVATSKAAKSSLQQPVEREQMAKLLATGKTDLLDKPRSMRTRRASKSNRCGTAQRAKLALNLRRPNSCPARHAQPPGPPALPRPQR